MACLVMAQGIADHHLSWTAVSRQPVRQSYSLRPVKVDVTSQARDGSLWQMVTRQAGFSPRDTSEGYVFNDRMWLSNGYNLNGGVERDLWVSADGDTWRQMLWHTPYDPYAEIAVLNGDIYAVKSSVWKSADGLRWTRLADTPFGERPYGELVAFNGWLWQLGSGCDVWRSADGLTWECVNECAGFGPRFGSAVTVFDNKLWLLGGAVECDCGSGEHYPDKKSLNDVWFSEDGITWERALTGAPWEPRMWSAAQAYEGKLHLVGGYSNRNHTNFKDVWTTTDGLTWQPQPVKWSARHEPTVIEYRGSLWLTGGNSWPLMNDVWKLAEG